jgi:transcriptional regulator with XRE-family HTH domain
MSDFNIQIKVRNARLLRAIRAKAGTAAEFARLSGVSQTALSALLTMRLSPLKANGEWSATVQRICEWLGAMPEDIWPAHMERVLLKRAETEIELTSEQVLSITDGADNSLEQRELLARWVSKANIVPRDLEVLMMRNNGLTLEEVAQAVGTTRERIRQREMRAQRRIRDAARRDGYTSIAEVLS